MQMLEMIWPHIQDFDTVSKKELEKEESGSGSDDGSKEEEIITATD